MPRKNSKDRTPAHARFFELTEPLLERPGVTRSTMMGFPCVRVNGDFFASVHRDGTHLIVKMSREDVETAIARGDGEAFAPNGRRFKEWLAIPTDLEDTWPAHLDTAYTFIAGPNAP